MLKKMPNSFQDTENDTSLKLLPISFLYTLLLVIMLSNLCTQLAIHNLLYTLRPHTNTFVADTVIGSAILMYIYIKVQYLFSLLM